MLEDDLREPLAGAYATKMIPNSSPDADARLRQLAQAVKYVYASTFFRAATAHAEARGRAATDERMAVLIQEVVGAAHDRRFYPHISVSRARRTSIHSASPSRATARQPGPRTRKDDRRRGNRVVLLASLSAGESPVQRCQQLLEQTQREFWAIDLATSATGSGLPNETEFLGRHPLATAEQDGVLAFLASTYDPDDDRITMGLAGQGPRLLDFAPILRRAASAQCAAPGLAFVCASKSSEPSWRSSSP